MTGWTKLTTNEITLQERLTPSGFGAAPGAPRHFNTDDLWQASWWGRFGPPSTSRIYWACRAIANTLAQTDTGERFEHVVLQMWCSVFLLLIQFSFDYFSLLSFIPQTHHIMIWSLSFSFIFADPFKNGHGPPEPCIQAAAARRQCIQGERELLASASCLQLLNPCNHSFLPTAGYLWAGKLPGTLPRADCCLQQPPGSGCGESWLHTGAVRTVSVGQRKTELQNYS